MSFNFSGKVGIIAGAGGGMGQAIARSLIEGGCNLVLADKSSAPDLPSGPGSHVFVKADLSDKDDVEKVFQTLDQTYSRLDYLVNCTGVLWIGRDVSAVDIDMDVWDQVFDINLKSFVHMIRGAVPRMQANEGGSSGSMVHFSSIDARYGDDVPQDAYGATKAAIIRLSKSIAVQYGPDNIRSNTILPGPAMTPMQARWEGRDDIQKAVAARIPARRLGTPEDMANACLFLLSDQAGYISGTELMVDGGLDAVP